LTQRFNRAFGPGRNIGIIRKIGNGIVVSNPSARATTTAISARVIGWFGRN